MSQVDRRPFPYALGLWEGSSLLVLSHSFYCHLFSICPTYTFQNGAYWECWKTWTWSHIRNNSCDFYYSIPGKLLCYNGYTQNSFTSICGKTWLTKFYHSIRRVMKSGNAPANLIKSGVHEWKLLDTWDTRHLTCYYIEREWGAPYLIISFLSSILFVHRGIHFISQR